MNNVNGEPGGKIVVVIDADLEDIIPGYLANRIKDIDLLLEAAAAADFETVRVTGHSMKGSGGGYGFDAITEYGSILEQAAKRCDVYEIEEALGNLRGFLERVEVKYENAG